MLRVVLALSLQWQSLVLPTATCQRWIGCASKYDVVPVEATSSERDTISATAGVVDFAREGGTTAELFEKFCQSSLCMESWDFIVDAVHYEMVEKMQNIVEKNR